MNLSKCLFFICTGLESRVTLQKTHTSVFASLRDITVYDPTAGALYPKVFSQLQDMKSNFNESLSNGHVPHSKQEPI